MPIPDWLPTIGNKLVPTVTATPQGVTTRPIGTFKPTAQTPTDLLPGFFPTTPFNLASVLPPYLAAQQDRFYQGGIPAYRGGVPATSNVAPPVAQGAPAPPVGGVPATSGPQALVQRQPQAQGGGFRFPSYYAGPSWMRTNLR